MQILEVVATVPGLLPSLAEAIKSNRVPTKHIKSLSWFMIKLGCGSKSSRQDPSVHDLVDALCDHQSPYATKLRTVFRGATNGALCPCIVIPSSNVCSYLICFLHSYTYFPFQHLLISVYFCLTFSDYGGHRYRVGRFGGRSARQRL